MAELEQQVERKGREGGRWINERPTPEEFADWFTKSMKIDSALNPEDYIGGVVLIPAVDARAKYVAGFRQGKPVIEERQELAFIPYAKVEARIAYFWDLLEAHEQWIGVVERVTPPRLGVEEVLLKTTTTSRREDGGEEEVSEEVGEYGKPGGLATMAHQLPEGFSIASVPVGQGYAHFICCTMRVAIYDRERYEAKPESAVPLRVGQGTKQVPLLKSTSSSSWADDSALMKAETGALGRALGFAGIFVIPGSGVATAEDVIEAIANDGRAPTTEASTQANQGPAAPEQAVRTGAEEAVDEEEALKRRATELWKEVQEHPAATGEFGNWARSRRLSSLGDARGAMLKGVVKKLENLLDQAKEPGDVPAEATREETTAGDGAKEAESADAEPSGQAG